MRFHLFNSFQRSRGFRFVVITNIAIAITVFASAASANNGTYNLDLNRRVSRGSKVTYLQLMQKAFPKATTDFYNSLESESMSDIRQLNTGAIKKAYAGPLRLSYSDGFKNRGGTRAMLLFWLYPKSETPGDGEAFTSDGRRILRYSTMIMMLVKTTGEPELLDMVETDQSDIQSYIAMSNLAGYFWKVDYHDNCEKHLKNYQLVSSKNDRLQAVFSDLPVIYDDDDCGRKIDQEPFLATGPNQTMFLNVVSEVTEYVRPCSTRGGLTYTKYFQYKFRREPDGMLTTLVSPKKALHRELVKWELEMDPETGSK